MTEPVIVPRAEHSISRRAIDQDALKVLYRLQEAGHTAYLVGGSVRDLLLDRRPKDFDIGTSAHPYQIKKLFRNCWIIGRRFRLAHVRFGPKTIEVATFRRHLPAGSENEPAESTRAHADRAGSQPASSKRPDGREGSHDNTFGTPEEDAFRRDFTINALFYDIATFSIIDYVGGLQDLRAGVVRSIGDPSERFQEDPVRMMRAIVMASRLGFRLDPPVIEGIVRFRSLMSTAAPARLIEEYYKVLRSGAAEPTFAALAEHRLLEPVTPELQRSAQSPALRNALASLDAYRGKHDAAPVTLTNAILLGTLLVPLGLMPHRERSSSWSAEDADLDAIESGDGDVESTDHSPATSFDRFKRRRQPKEPILRIGSLPIARRDTERLRQVLAFQRRLADLEMSARAKRGLLGRSSFHDALTWIEIHGESPGVLEHWRGFIEALGPEAFDRAPATAATPPADAGAERPDGRRRRGRRRRGGRQRFKRPPE